MFNASAKLKGFGGNLKRFAILTVCLTGLSTGFVTLEQHLQSQGHIVAGLNNADICSTAKFLKN